MSLSRKIYQRFPDSLQPLLKRSYCRFHPDRISEAEVRKSREEFVETVFDSEAEFQSYIDELDEEPVADFLEEAQSRVREKRGFSGLGNEYFHEVYAFVRKTKPEVIVETGVRDGWSTLYLLSALNRNDSGHLYSIDYPIRADETDEQFKSEAPSYENISPTIPAETDPGWIVPETLRGRWTSIIGKSQDKLPELYTEIDEIDVFIHDSDHSLPCMIFEYELAWEWIGTGGYIFSDDIVWNDAFEKFTSSKDCQHGITAETFGYVRKTH